MKKNKMLINAASSGHCTTVKWLLWMGTDENGFERTREQALVAAAKTNCLECVEAILIAGVINVDAFDKDKYGCKKTSLMYASQWNNAKMLCLLLRYEYTSIHPDPFAFCSNVGYDLEKEICFIFCKQFRAYRVRKFLCDI